MAQTAMTRAAGLYTFQNPLGTIPEGSLLQADNVVIDKDATLEPRRGLKIYGSAMGGGAANTAKQLFQYKDRILRHWGNTLEFDSDGAGTFLAFSGTFTEPISGIRIRGIEQNGNFYFTTNAGVKRISASSNNDFTTASGYITDAGGIKALDLTLALNQNTGFFTQESTVAYRIVWGIKDLNGNLILGFPSERAVIYNPLTPLLIKDFNKLLIQLDQSTSSGGINDGNYYSTLNVLQGATSSTLQNNINSLVAKLDNDTIITEGTIKTASTNIVGNVASLVFNSNVSTFLEVGDTVVVSGLSAVSGSDHAAYLNGQFVITSLATTSTANDTIKYTLPSASVKGDTTSGSATITNITDTTNLRVGQTVIGTGIPASTTILSLSSNTATLSANATATTSQEDLSAFFADFSAPLADTGGTVKRLKYTLLTQPAALSPSPSSQELTALQAYYDSIVTDLQGEPAGITTSSLYTGDNSTQSSTVDVTFTIPSQATTANFYQIYRTAVFTSTGVTPLSTIDPGDEMGLVFEGNPSSTDISNKSIKITDITPDSFRGVNLYTNPNSGEGIAQANEVPPLARDIASFKGSTFFANTQTKQQLSIALLGISKLVSNQSTLTISDGITTNTYTFVTGSTESTTFTTVAASSLPQSSYVTFSSANNTNNYYLWYDKAGGGTDPSIAGKIGIKVALSGTETATQVATKSTQAIQSNSLDFSVTNSTNTFTIVTLSNGFATDAADGGTPTGFGIVINQQGSGEDAATRKVQISHSSTSTSSQDVDATARSLVRIINKQSSEIVNAFYLSGALDVPGKISLQAKELGQHIFYLVTDSAATGSSFSPDLSPSRLITNISIANPTVITSTAHGLATGAQIEIAGSNSTPSIDGIYTITRLTANTFSISVNVTGSGNRGGWIILSDANASDNDVAPNRLYFSKSLQPDAVPILNYTEVGAKDTPILRIIALRDSLFILKSDAVFRLTGETVANFLVTLFDNSTFLLAPDTASVLNNQIYMHSSQGIATISDTGISVISRPIENLIKPLIDFTNFTFASHAIGYESDRSYLLFTLTNPSDTISTQCFRYNTFTQTWTRWPISKTSSIVNVFDDKLYVGAGDINNIEVERKTFSRLDFADRQYTYSVLAGGVNGDVLMVSSTAHVNVGDAVQQIFYLSSGQFNRTLQKIDNNTSIPPIHKTYLSTLQITPGGSLRTQLTALASKLDSEGDTSGGYSALMTGATDFPTIQSEYNSLVNALNADPLLASPNFQTSNGTTTIEMRINGVNTTLNEITIDFPLLFVEGPIVIYNRIATNITWAPHFFQDPSLLKHVRENSLMFLHNNITTASMSFSTDLLPALETTSFSGSGAGAFGNFPFGSCFFGGDGAPIPFRTLIPKSKQRCRFLNIQFSHGNAFEQYALLGVSHTYEVTSSRAYR